MPKSLAVALAILIWLVSGVRTVAESASDADIATSSLWVRTRFVIGAPGRLDGESDRRYPRRYQRADSAVAAYADIEMVQDPTWLRHEVEHYARRAMHCTAAGWCRREVRKLAAGR